jgi:ABC-type branched-subunit amino acid transport system ATPase component/branched-subunit amino acid ABC-type transport system permease component
LCANRDGRNGDADDTGKPETASGVLPADVCRASSGRLYRGGDVVFLEFLLLGLGVGAGYALEAQGITLIYRASGVINFGQTGFAIVGAFVYYAASNDGAAIGVALAAGAVAATLAGLVTYLLVMRPLAAAPPLIKVVATLGVFLICESVTNFFYPNGAAGTAPSVLPHQPLRIGHGVSVGADRLYLVGIAALATLLLAAAFRWTKYGLYTRAVAEDDVTFRGLGHSSDRISALNWALGGLLAGLTGILLSTIVGVSTTQISLLLVPALAASLIGRFQSFGLTFAAAIVIGVADSEATNYLPGGGWSQSIALVVIIAYLSIRGHLLPARGYIAARLPVVGDGRIRIVPAAIAVLAIGVALDFAPAAWANAAAISFGIAIIYMSLVIVTGYAGQLSLAQLSIAGFGALIAAHLSSDWHFPFLAALVVAVLAALPVGIIAGIPAFRARGMSVAIATLGLGFVIDEAVLANPSWSGGGLGIALGAPTFFGLDVNPILQPARYAIMSFGFLVLASLLLVALRRSHIGRRWLAIRANERAAASVGVHVGLSKLLALSVGSMLAAAGGVIIAFSEPLLTLTTGFSTNDSINAVVYTVIGGIGFVLGPINGGLIAAGGIVSYALTDYTGLSYSVVALIAGVVVIFNVLAAPAGVVPLLGHQLRAVGRLLPGPRRPQRDRRSVPLASEPSRRHESPPLQLSDVSVRFGGVTALSGVSLEVHAGQVLGVIGPNGAGKTSLVDVLTGLSRQHDGVVSVGNSRLNGVSPARRVERGISRSFQGIELFEDMSVLDNLRVAAEGRRASGTRGPRWRGSRAPVAWTRAAWARRPGRPGRAQPKALTLPAPCMAAVQAFGLAAELASLPLTLPYGRRRLAGIARSLAADPVFLILDEPAAGLGDADRGKLTELIRTLAATYGLGVLLIEHDMALVLASCDSIVALDGGKVIAHGLPDEIRQSEDVIRSFLGAKHDTPAAETAI